MYLVIWENILSPHKSSLTRALGETGHEVVFVAAEELTEDRRGMGWSVPDFGKARLVVSPREREIENIVAKSPAEAVHILGGARWSPLGDRATAHCISFGKRVGIMSEPADDRGWRGSLRWVKYTLERFTSGRHFNFILAMGETGVRWFRRCGYPPRRIFPFAYFTEPITDVRPHIDSSESSPVRLLFLGQCIRRKAVDLLLDAFIACADMDCTLVIMGDGPIKSSLVTTARAGPCRDRIQFLPATDARNAMLQLQESDLLVLPSRFDGWGAVVSEALMLGVPVICSDHCGAADLLRESWRGEVCPAGSVPALVQSLRKWIAQGKRTQKTSARIKAWSRCIGGQAAASYLEQILAHIYQGARRSEAPWRRT